MLQRPRSDCLSMPAGQYWTIGIVEDLRGRGAEQHLAEYAGVRGHNDEVEFAVSRGGCDLGCRVAKSQHSRMPGNGEFCCQEGIESQLADGAMFLGDFGSCSQVEFKTIVACKVDHVNQGNTGMKEDGRTLDIGGHGDTGRRKVNRKENVCDYGHVSLSVPLDSTEAT